MTYYTVRVNTGIIVLYCLDECHLVALIKFTKEIEDWEMLGVYLGIKNVILMDIKRKNHQLPGSARKDMLMTWLDGGKATRAKFIEALKDMGYLRIVQEIESQNGNNKDYFMYQKLT